MTSRVPRHDLSVLAVSDDASPTLDHEPVGFARGSGDRDPIASTPEGEVADGPTEVAGWELLKALRAELASTRAEVARQATVTAGVKKRNDRAYTLALGGTGLIGVGVVAVVKLAFFAGGESNAKVQHEREHVENRAAVAHLQLVTVPALHVAISANTSEIANLRGALDAISRLGAVRVQGPAPQPLLPGDP